MSGGASGYPREAAGPEDSTQEAGTPQVQQLQETAGTLRALVDTCPLAIVDLDLEGRVRLWSAAAERLFGWRADEVLGRTAPIFTEEGWAQLRENLERFQRGEPITAIEGKRRRKDGTLIDVDIWTAPHRDAQGRVVGTVRLLADSTQRKQAEAALRESEAQFRTLADSIPHLAWMAEADGSIHWYNRRWYEYTGTRPEDMRADGGRGWRRVHDPAELPRVEARFFAAIASGEPWEDTFPLRRHDGEFRLHLSRAMPVRDAQGRVVRWFGTNTDVEEQRRAADALKRSEERERFLSRASRTLVDAEGGVEDILREVARLAASSVATYCLVDLVREDGSLERVAYAHREPAQEALLRRFQAFPPSEEGTSPQLDVLHTGQSWCAEAFTPELRRKVARGPEHLALLDALDARSVMAVAMRAQGTSLGLLTFASCEPGRTYGAADVTMAEELARRAVAAVQKARLLAQARGAEWEWSFLAEASRVLSSSLDYQATLEAVAKLAVPALADWCTVDLAEEEGGWRRLAVAHVQPEKAALAWELPQRYPLPADASHGYPKVLRTGQPELLAHVPDAILQGVARDAEHLALLREVGLTSALCVPLLVRGRAKGAISFFYGRSGRHFGERELRLAENLAQRAALSLDNALLYREAREAVRLRDEFLSVASHELRTPLTSLRLQHELVSRDVPPEAYSRVQARLEGAQRQVTRLSGLVESLLDVSRIAAGRLTLERAEVDLRAILQEAVGRLREVFQQAGCEVEVHAPAPVVGRWDAHRLDQVLVNLLTNAAKYGAGKPIHVLLEADAGTARLAITDQGIGIAFDALPRLFGKFERAVSERHYGGLGLGLFISRQIIETHGGGIRVRSAPGQGATFTVELPLNPGEQDRGGGTP